MESMTKSAYAGPRPAYVYRVRVGDVLHAAGQAVVSIEHLPFATRRLTLADGRSLDLPSFATCLIR